MAASCYESHRLVYLALFAGLLMGIDAGLRVAIAPNTPAWYEYTVLSTPLMVFFGLSFGALGWVGPLRSDYTHQLVRSRLHAVRIIAMYAVLFPPLLMATVVALLMALSL